MDKQVILDFLNFHAHADDKNYASVMSNFFIFLIELKYKNHLSKIVLYDLLMEIVADHQQSEFIYDIVADTLDYFVGWHSPLTPTHVAYDFVQQLNAE